MQNSSNFPLKRSEVVSGLISELSCIEAELTSERFGPLTALMGTRAGAIKQLIQERADVSIDNIPRILLSYGYDAVLEYDYLFGDSNNDPKVPLHYSYEFDTKFPVATERWFENYLKEKRNETSN